MIDWFSGLIGYDAMGLQLGRVIVVDPQGGLEYMKDANARAVGSHDSSIQVSRDSPNGAMREAVTQGGLLEVPNTVLRVSGNPVKFLQGHNVAGVSVSELVPVLRDLARQLSTSTDKRKRKFKNTIEVPGAVNVDLPAVYASRVDIAISIDYGSHELVHHWLRAAESMTRSRHGRPLVSGDTVYWGQHSRRWSIKAYCKRCELEAHPVGDKELNEKLQKYVGPQLRLELTLRRPELKDRVLSELDESLVLEYFGKITIGVEDMKKVTRYVQVESMTTRGLPLPQRLVLDQWFHGADVRRIVDSRTTFYRYRKNILEVVGVDISLPCKLDLEAVTRLEFSLKFMAEHTVLARDIPEWLRKLMYQPSDV
ncbi:MAG: hypothetical protein KAJ19_30285 [Gammaproteobacteria bacterium]|nr:hypothetical protein [Gammaproteobacteria bacterium]